MKHYRVVKKGFHNGVLYHPEGEGKRNTLTVDKPIKGLKEDSWLKLISEKDMKKEGKKNKAEKAKSAETAEAIKKDKEEIEGASKQSSNVEVLR